MGLQLTPPDTLNARNQLHLQQLFIMFMLNCIISGMSGICILFVFHTHINRHLHWLFIDITDIQCWWVVLYMSKTVYCIFWDLLGILKTINSLHILDLYITPIMTNFLTSWHIFWFYDKHLAYCWRPDKPFDAMTNVLTRWRHVDVMASFLK